MDAYSDAQSLLEILGRVLFLFHDDPDIIHILPFLAVVPWERWATQISPKMGDTAPISIEATTFQWIDCEGDPICVQGDALALDMTAGEIQYRDGQIPREFTVGVCGDAFNTFFSETGAGKYRMLEH